MQHIYSNQLIAYLFEEIDSKSKENVERELATNSDLREELEELKSCLSIISKCQPLSPSADTIQTILSEAKNIKTIQID